MPRLLFEKKENAIWISHLDLMRLFQRAFKRAGIPLTHTHGFNPRPSVSIALPLSVGVESGCELLDFEIEAADVACSEVMERLNQSLISGVHVLDVYTDGRKLRDLALLKCIVTMEYTGVAPEHAESAIAELFTRPALVVPKRTKNGTQDQDIIPMIRSITVKKANTHTVCLEALVCCQNPTLNPLQLVAAIELHAPQFKPDFSSCVRCEIYDTNEIIFR